MGARVLDATRVQGGKTSVRVAVNMDMWTKGYIVTIGLNAEDIVVQRAIHAKQADASSASLANIPPGMRSFSFMLDDEPVEMPAFAVVFETEVWHGVAAVACSPPASSPPPPSPQARGKGSGKGDGNGGGGGTAYPLNGNDADGDGDGDAFSYGADYSSVAPRGGGSSGGGTSSGGGGGTAIVGLLVGIATLITVVALVLRHKGGLAALAPALAKELARRGGGSAHSQAKVAAEETASMVNGVTVEDDEPTPQSQGRVGSLSELGLRDLPDRRDVDEAEDAGAESVVSARAASIILGRPESMVNGGK